MQQHLLRIWKEKKKKPDRHEVRKYSRSPLGCPNQIFGFRSPLKRLSVLILRATVFIFTSSSSALLGRPRCSLSIWLSLLAIFNTLFWVYADLFHEKTDERRKYSKSAIFVWYENGRPRNTQARKALILRVPRFYELIDGRLHRTFHQLFIRSITIRHEGKKGDWSGSSRSDHISRLKDKGNHYLQGTSSSIV